MTEVQTRKANEKTDSRSDSRARESAQVQPVKAVPEEAAAPAAPVARSAGAQLARAREAHGWTIEQVAGHLKLAVRQVIAIEGDDFASLPPFVVTRGFIKHYAKLVELDADTLLALIQPPSSKMPSALKSDRPLSAPFSDTRAASGSNRRWLVWGGVLIALVLLAGLLLESGMLARIRAAASQTVSHVENVAASSSQSEDTAAASSTSEVPSDSIVKGVNATAADSGAETAASPVANGPSAQSGQVANVSDLTAPSQPAASRVIAPQPDAGTAAGAPAAAAGSAITGATPVASGSAVNGAASGIEMTAHLDTWLEIRRPDNTLVFSGIVRAGEKKVVDARPPLNFRVGNVRGLSLSYQGQPVNMQPFTQGNTARFGLPSAP